MINNKEPKKYSEEHKSPIITNIPPLENPAQCQHLPPDQPLSQSNKVFRKNNFSRNKQTPTANYNSTSFKDNLPYNYFAGYPNHCPPPGTPPSFDHWDLQFCNWWGWNWIKKHDIQAIKRKEQACNCNLRAYNLPINKQTNKQRRERKVAKNPDFFTWINHLLKQKRSPRHSSLNDNEKRQLQDLYDTPCSSISFRSQCDKNEYDCRSIKLTGEYECYSSSGKETSRSTVIIEKNACQNCMPVETNGSLSTDESVESMSFEMEHPCKCVKHCKCNKEKHLQHEVCCNAHSPCKIPRLCRRPMPLKTSCRPQLRLKKDSSPPRKNRCPYPIPTCKDELQCPCLGKTKNFKTDANQTRIKKHCIKPKRFHYHHHYHQCCCCQCCCCGCCSSKHIEKNENKEQQSIEKQNIQLKEPLQNKNQQNVLFVSQAFQEGEYVSPLSGQKYNLDPVAKILRPLEILNKIPEPLNINSALNKNFHSQVNCLRDSEHDELLSAVCDAILTAKHPDEKENVRKSFEKIQLSSNIELDLIKNRPIGGPPTIQDSFVNKFYTSSKILDSRHTQKSNFNITNPDLVMDEKYTSECSTILKKGKNLKPSKIPVYKSFLNVIKKSRRNPDKNSSLSTFSEEKDFNSNASFFKTKYVNLRGKDRSITSEEDSVARKIIKTENAEVNTKLVKGQSPSKHTKRQ